jgi:hypothetical protein
MSDRELAAETALFQRFLVWIYDSMAPKRAADTLPKPESALAVALTIKRAHRRLGTETPTTRELRKVLHGLELAYVEEMGTAALLPRRKSPLTAPMLHAILGLRSFTVQWPTVPLVLSGRHLRPRHVPHHVALRHAEGRRHPPAQGCRVDTARRWLQPPPLLLQD